MTVTVLSALFRQMTLFTNLTVLIALCLSDDVDNTGLVVGVLMAVLMLVAGTAIALVLYKRLVLEE